MATATDVKHPTLVEIERLGLRYTEEAQFELARLSADKRVQVRETKHYTPSDNVAQYAVLMGENQFPPIVVTSDDWIVDGNTRVAAATKRGLKFFPALVLQAEYERAPTKQQDELVALAATLNSKGGERLTAKEIRAVTARFIALNWKSEQIARAIGLKPSGVTAVKKEISAVEKLHGVGMGSNGELKGASLRALGSEVALGLNDDPYRGLASLAADAGFNASEITSTAKALRDSGSDRAAGDSLRALREEMADRIREQALTGSAKPPLSRQLRQHLGFVRRFHGHEQELIETDPKVSPGHVEAITEAVAILSAVLEIQK